jgi:hypothetical protein
MTEDDVVEVLCPNEPRITEVDPAPESDRMHGKSRILSNDLDRPEVERLLADLSTNVKPDG